jgi:DNA-binding response OmpR family regulator
VQGRLRAGTGLKLLGPASKSRPPYSPMRTALVIEDEEIAMRVFNAALRRAGFDVLQAGSGDEAFEACRAFDGQLEIIVCDVRLPRRSGTTVALELALLVPGVPILFTSGTPLEAWAATEFADLERLAQLSKYDFLQKPFHISTLDSKISNLVSGIHQTPPPLIAAVPKLAA